MANITETRDIITICDVGIKDYTARIGYHFLLNKSETTLFNSEANDFFNANLIRKPDNLPKLIFSKISTPKHNALTWKLVMKCLPNGKSQSRFRNIKDCLCAICHKELDSTIHGYFNCLLSNFLWNKVTKKLYGRNFVYKEDFLFAFYEGFRQVNSSIFKTTL